MKDMWMNVYNALIANETISKKLSVKEINPDSGEEEISYQIKFFEAPETFDTSKPFIIIDVFDGPQTNAYYGSDKPLSSKFNFQINVESMNRMLTKEIAKAVKDVMLAQGYGQLSGGLDTYFKETKRFVDARRYRKNTTIHDTDY
ncbi:MULTISPECIES: hypothetical protein [unclassified Enterococcus]|uniref:hypothetical protein n=1 Tax=unclassified Enterococcus TaxID=2608891 RepID=UPI0015523137|nr:MULTISPECIES: hypothetical protein [unclassified Enterococcus]MBS7578293.1 hypothetical protein [Enterococcus sp. MMGLQ5-2]MBS7585496.1 hypothetical protein [Enterococcus sp. MMGLQ5-1]NPD13353.1 hypothetical protein [Enterococcus sp. MMGLQ5-1]NPD38124.1 hypothetical protein [Enterococcus sp. MMGLQ5-2]